MSSIIPEPLDGIPVDRPFPALVDALGLGGLVGVSQLQHGAITVSEAGVEQHFGDKNAELNTVITVLDPAFYQKLVLAGSVGGGEAYIYGYWRCDNLTALVQIFARNLAVLDKMDSTWARLSRPLLKLLNYRNRNTVSQSKRNIAAHYDLGNAMYQLFLDPSMMYSSAVYPSGTASLADAQQHKLQQICQRLQLTAADHLIEIGTGWGSMAIFAAQHYGCKVTTTTISREQHDLAAARIQQAGLGDRITLLQSDYRDLTGQYDKLVSIEMIEAIGAQYLETFFGKLGTLLRPGGQALLQAITIEDHRYVQARDAVDYIKRFVFPGSFIPSLSAMYAAKTRASDLQVVHQEDFGLSYAYTLRAWRRRFMTRLPDVRAQGFDERFIRLWEFYLAYCEGGFLERSIGVSHLLMARPAHAAEAA